MFCFREMWPFKKGVLNGGSTVLLCKMMNRCGTYFIYFFIFSGP